MKRSLSGCLIGAMLFTLPGCSFLFVDGPPPDHAQREHFTCTTSRLGPIVDTIFGVTYAAQSIQVATANERGIGDGSSKVALGLAMLGLAGLFGASAYLGFADTSDCSDAMDALQARRTLQPPTVMPTQPEPGSSVGCISNEQCKIGRVCMQGTCVDPAPPVQVIVPVAPTPAITTPAPSSTTPAPAQPVDQTPVLLFEGLPSQNPSQTPPAPAPITP